VTNKILSISFTFLFCDLIMIDLKGSFNYYVSFLFKDAIEEVFCNQEQIMYISA